VPEHEVALELWLLSRPLLPAVPRPPRREPPEEDDALAATMFMCRLSLGVFLSFQFDEDAHLSDFGGGFFWPDLDFILLFVSNVSHPIPALFFLFSNFFVYIMAQIEISLSKSNKNSLD
jgi:hypothetical protein